MISLHEPELDELDEKYILDAIRSSWVSTGGPFVTQFENAIAEYVNSKYAISVCNGTIGLHLAIDCLKRKANIDREFEILLPSLTFIASANSVVHAGGTPVFVDCEQFSFQISVPHLKNIIETNYYFNSQNKQWKNHKSNRILLAVMPVHIMGWAVDMDNLADFCSERNIPIIEDATEALGTFYNNHEHIGKHGLVSVYSFNGNKILTTGGGGMVVTDNSEIATYLKHLSTTAKVDSLRYVHDEVGYNYRLVNILGALGCSQLKKLSQKLTLKKDIFNFYCSKLNSDNSEIYQQNNCLSNNWLINIIFKNNEQREHALNNLLRNNIQARPLWTPCHLQPALKIFNSHNNFINTEDIWKRSLSLPSSSHLNKSQLEKITSIITSSINGINYEIIK